MKIQVNKVFLKELSKIPTKERQKVENLLFNEIEKFSDLYQIPNIGKLKGYSNYFKIRIGDYRIGLRYTNDTLTFERILHRKDIYRVFP
jgi:mRNA interferase RelE/StbE